MLWSGVGQCTNGKGLRVFVHCNQKNMRLEGGNNGLHTTVKLSTGPSMRICEFILRYLMVVVTMYCTFDVIRGLAPWRLVALRLSHPHRPMSPVYPIIFLRGLKVCSIYLKLYEEQRSHASPGQVRQAIEMMCVAQRTFHLTRCKSPLDTPSERAKARALCERMDQAQFCM